jgi:hypothetical protein
VKTTADQRGPEPTRDEVFAFVDAHPSIQPGAVVRHFADQGRPIEGSKVRVWLSRRATGKIPIPPTPATPTVAADSVGSKGVGKWGEVLAAPPAAEGRARALVAADFPAEDRNKLRGAVRRLLHNLDSEEYAADPKKADAASRALMNLLKSCPDILTFDERTNGRVDDGGTAAREDAARRVRAALDPNSREQSSDG